MLKTTLFTILLIIAMSLSTLAQETEVSTAANRGGIGFQVGGASSIGGLLYFNLEDNMRIGSHLGFIYDGGDKYAKSSYAILFAPYFNLYFAKINALNFFAQAAFVVNSGQYSEYDANRAEYVRVTSTTTQFNINAGGEWYPTRSKNVSIYAGFNFFNLILSPSRIKAGLGAPFIGINWIIF